VRPLVALKDAHRKIGGCYNQENYMILNLHLWMIVIYHSNMKIERPDVASIGARKELFDLFEELYDVWNTLGIELIQSNEPEIDVLKRISNHLKQHNIDER